MNKAMATTAFCSVLAEVLNRGDAHACTTDETIRRIDQAMSDAGLIVLYAPE